MTQFVPPPNPEESEIHLASLRQEVNTWAGDLDAGETFPVGVQDIQRYQQAKIKLSNPKSNLERLTPALFNKVGVPLSALHAKQMHSQFDFYHMTLSVQMRPEPGTYFRALGCQLNFALAENGEPIVVSIFPDEQWKAVFKFGGSLSLNLDGNLGFEVGITGADTAVLQTLPANLQSKIVNQNEMKSTIWFDGAELHTLCLDIGYHYENLPGRSKPERAQELALLTLREGTFDALQSYCKNKRPHVDWGIFE
ncbi:hypothetical protein MNBD_CHLOROFLEXI01-355 [hydrothermal vent metagenome]|uniref:Effector-associated domain-containing protein n=1 Tax=hydrothermal vent metagenome TaxID=652676 RepID=A0A3B0WIA7_9ZZZZ